MLKIRRSWDRLIFNMGIPILVRRHLYTETTPRPLPGMILTEKYIYIFFKFPWLLMILYLFMDTMTCSKMAAVILANLPAHAVLISVQGRGLSKGWVTFTWSECLPVASCIIVWSNIHLCDDWNQFDQEAKRSRACVTYNFGLPIQIWWNFNFNIFQIIWSLHIFAHDMTAMLSWHVQKCVLIWIRWIKWQQCDLLLNFALSVKILSEMFSWWCQMADTSNRTSTWKTVLQSLLSVLNIITIFVLQL